MSSSWQNLSVACDYSGMIIPLHSAEFSVKVPVQGPFRMSELGSELGFVVQRFMSGCLNSQDGEKGKDVLGTSKK